MVDNEKEFTHIDLFSGIGGFTLAAEWAGFRTVAFCEKEKFCQKVLKKRFGAITYTDNERQPRNLRETVSRREDKTIPNSEFGSRNSGRSSIYRPTLIPEIRDVDGTKWRGATLLTGGFPCQPFSVAEQQRGKEDDRYLWPEMLRVISEAKPHWILAENVPGIFRMALDTVLADLEGEGYTTGTFIIPACGLNAPHRRNRVWIVARNTESDTSNSLKGIWEGKKTITRGSNSNACNTTGNRHQKRLEKTRRKEQKSKQGGVCESEGTNSHAPDSKSRRRGSILRQGRKKEEIWNTGIDRDASNSTRGRQWKSLSERKKARDSCESNKRDLWEEDWHEVAARFCRVDDGISDRTHRLKALGNAIVPQIAFQILKNIAWIENELAG